jgi:hypothetical protein
VTGESQLFERAPPAAFDFLREQLRAQARIHD